MKVSIYLTRFSENSKNSTLTAVRVMAAGVSGPFGAETQIICLWHEGLMTCVQCQLGFVGDPCSYQKTPFEKFF